MKAVFGYLSAGIGLLGLAINSVAGREMVGFLDNISSEYIGLTDREAYNIYVNAEFYFKQLIKYESSKPEAEGDIILEESK